jgi:hypothetical protein
MIVITSLALNGEREGGSDYGRTAAKNVSTAAKKSSGINQSYSML